MATTLNPFDAPSAAPGSILEPATGIVPGPEVTSSPSDPAMLRGLYSAMLRCRMVEERVENLAKLQIFKSSPKSPRAVEATEIGSLMELRAGDGIASQVGFASRMFAGQPLGLYFAELYGVRLEYMALAPEAANTPIHLLPGAPTAVAQLNVAAGFALALKRAQRRNVVVVLLADGENALGYWHEAATLAAAERLPIIFVAISSPSTANDFGDSDARQRAASYGIPGITVDGGDVVGSWRVAQESIYRARGGAGPTLIDSQLPPAQSNSRPHAASDPLARMQHYLEKRKLWKQSWKDELTRKFAAEIDEAQSFLPGAAGTQ